MQAIPVFAMPESKTVSVYFSCGDNAVPMYVESDDVKIPLYIYYTDVDNNMYINGIVQMSKPNFTFKLNNNSVLAYSYFEPDLSDGLQFVFPAENDNVCKLYFDNHNSYAGVGNMHIVGYFHFSVASTSQYTIEPTFNYIQALISYQNVKQNDSPLGFVDAMIEAINSSSNVDEMLTLLDKIGGDSGYLPEILSTMQTNHTALYNLINSVWLTDQTVLSVSQNTYTTVLSILNALNNIDNTLDTISWDTLRTGSLEYSSTYNGEYINTSGVVGKEIYIKLDSINPPSYDKALLAIEIPIGRNDAKNFPDLQISIIRSNYDIGDVLGWSYVSNGRIVVYVDNWRTFNNSAVYIHIVSDYSIYWYNNTVNVFSLSRNDIEYWQVYSALKTGRIEKILSELYSTQVNHADDIKDEVDTNLQNLANDIIVTKPSQVANIADDYIEQVDTTHNYQVFSWLTAPTFVLMMSIVAGLAVISYMLYGGQ